MEIFVSTGNGKADLQPRVALGRAPRPYAVATDRFGGRKVHWTFRFSPLNPIRPPMTAFVKMHGLGNDFVIFDARDASLSMTTALSRAVADRHFGIGCDTVVVMRPGGAAADVDVQFFNADGSESESCLNATRCVARLLLDERGLARVKLSTKGGLLVCNDAGKSQVVVDIGEPRLAWDQVPLASQVDTTQFPLDIGGSALPVSAVSVGNPHCVIFRAGC